LTDDADLEADADDVGAFVAEHVQAMMARCDTVQVFVTVHTADGQDTRTYALHAGDGHWHARYGQVREWLIRQERRMALQEDLALADDEDDEDDEDE
jgi:hypothetical protein